MDFRCEFCDEQDGGTENSFRMNIPVDQLKHRVLMSTGHFYVVVGLGALTNGYLLILPHRHIRSMGYIDSVEEFHELDLIIGKIRTICEKHYQHPYIFFEHGSFSDNKPGGSCIDHAHIHAIPLQQNITPMLAAEFAASEIKHLHDLREPIYNETPYIFLEDQLQRRFVYKIPDTLPSQYLRRIWATFLDRGEQWDWGVYVEENNVINTYNSLLPYFD